MYGKLTSRKEVRVVGYFSTNLRDIEAKGVEMLVLLGMKTEKDGLSLA